MSDYTDSTLETQLRECGYVYLIGVKGHKVYKIGHSTNPERRIKTLQAQRDVELEIVGVIPYHNYQQAEFYWQRKFARYQLSGEWFALPDEQVQIFKDQLL